MQSARTKLPVIFIAVSVIFACALRFFQLFTLTDIKSGLVVGGEKTSCAIYGIIALCALACGVFAKSIGRLDIKFVLPRKNNYVIFCSTALSVFFFIDFIHQCFNCYNYVERVSYVEPAYIVPLIICAALGIVSSFYFAVFTMTVKGTNYDFRNFTIFHFAPAAWAFTRLCVILTKLVDFFNGIETYIEFITLVFVICFSFSFVSSVDKKDGTITSFFAFSSVMLLSASLILTVPRVLMMITGNYNLLTDTDFSLGTYFMLGIFAVSVLKNVNKESLRDS